MFRQPRREIVGSAGSGMFPPIRLVEFWRRTGAAGRREITLQGEEARPQTDPSESTPPACPPSHRPPRRLAPLAPELRNQRLGSFSDCTRRWCSPIHASASASVANGLTLVGWLSGILTSTAN